MADRDTRYALQVIFVLLQKSFRDLTFAPSLPECEVSADAGFQSSRASCYTLQDGNAQRGVRNDA
jgi:hypothetical protein